MHPLVLAQLKAAQSSSGPSSSWMTLIVIIALVATFAAVLMFCLSRYRRVPPSRALIIFGGGKDFEVIIGGAKIIWPVINEAYELDLKAFQIELDLKNAPNKDRIPINMKAMATLKISKEDALIRKAAEAFGRMTPEQISKYSQNILEGHLRVVVGQIDMDTILSKRDEFNTRIQTEAATELKNLGLDVVILNILEVSDPNGVIDALGKPKIAMIKAEAAIQEAEQTRRQTVDVTNAQREAATTRAQNEARIAEAERDKDLKVLEYNATVATQRATTEQAGPLSAANAKQAVVQAEVAVEVKKAEAEIGLQDAIRRRTEASNEATIITNANAEKRRLVIVAQGTAEARTTTAAAEQTALTAEGAGQAAKTQSIGLAEAEVNRRKGLAAAEVTKETGLAGAAAEEASLRAKAAGRQAMLDAFKEMTEPQQKMFLVTTVLDRLPEALAAFGSAGEQVMEPIAKALTASLSNIDSITVYDSGNGGADGKSALGRMIQVGPEVMFQALLRAKALGMLPALQGMLAKIGLDISQFATPAPNAGGEGAPAAAPAAEAVAE